jgi:hypothetical protein
MIYHPDQLLVMKKLRQSTSSSDVSFDISNNTYVAHNRDINKFVQNL